MMSDETTKHAGSAKVQGELWGTHARDWSELQEPMGAPLWEAALDAARVGRGTRLLDAGCGGGGASVLAARRGARVCGLDAAASLVAVARERLPAGDFRTGDLAELPWLDRSFDVVLALNVLQYAEDPDAALAELVRVTAEGGVVAIGSWGSPGEQDFAAVFAAVGRATGGPGPMLDLSAPGVLDRLLEAAGLRATATGVVEVPFVYADDEHFWRANRAGGPLVAAARRIGEAELRATLLEAARPFRTAGGGYRFRNEFRYVVAEPLAR